MYLSDLRNHHDIVEILTVCREGEDVAMASRLSIRFLPESGDVILFEGIETPTSQGLKASRSANYQRKTGILRAFFPDQLGPNVAYRSVP